MQVTVMRKLKLAMYEGFAEAWPKMTDTGHFGVKMNTMPKFVASRTLEKTELNQPLPATNLRLVDSTITSTGVTVLTYTKA